MHRMLKLCMVCIAVGIINSMCIQNETYLHGRIVLSSKLQCATYHHWLCTGYKQKAQEQKTSFAASPSQQYVLN